MLRSVLAAAAQQVGVAAAFDHAALVHHQDLVGVHHRRQAVGDDQGGAADGDAVELGLDRLLRLQASGPDFTKAIQVNQLR